ncbi:MAG: hypothetical protein J5697_02485 [Clostridia bacterium]|nr:hypothetical protein [Clostridia bacterium]
MKGFWKELDGKQRKELRTRLFYAVLSGLMLVVFGTISFAWFASNRGVNQSGMDIAISTESIDIVVVRTSYYDAYDNMTEFKTKLGEAEYSTTENDTDVEPRIAYEMVNESVVDGMRYLQPGSYGTVTFYIRPKANKDNTVVNFVLERGGFSNEYDEHDNLEITEVDSSAVLDLLKGHLLFFTGRTGADYEHFVYTGFLTDRFSYDMGAHDKCGEVGRTDCYKVVLYWEWPLKYYDITDNISTKYPAAVEDYIAANPTFFFGTSEIGDSEEAKSDAFDDGDQTIGDNTDYFVLYIKVK